ncbi:hypothetical protein [Micromonospora sp. SH-82]|uniref:hypothetical protein n=1 Tax=Micromonospora sp. SH-82 TaxID=3132938 RepID=UPI003EB7BC76
MTRGQWRRHQRHAETLLRRLDVQIPAPLTITGLVAALERRRGRPINMMAMTSAATVPCGLWLATEHRDYVLYSARSSALVQVQTVLHELMHIALGHVGAEFVNTADGLLDDCDFTPVTTALARSAPLARTPATYEEQQELDAEVLATYLGARLDSRRDVIDVKELESETAAVMQRIAAALTE